MLETIRKHHYILMLIVAVVVCVAFVFFSDTGSGRGNPDSKPLFVVDGKELYRADLQQLDRQRTVIESLLDPSNQFARFMDPLGIYLSTLGGSQFGPAIVQRYGRTRSDDLNIDFCLNVATLRRQAEILGVEVEKQDVERFLTTLPAFQTNGQFDPSKYQAYLTRGILGDKTNTERLLGTTLRDVMLFQNISKLIGGKYEPSQAEINQMYASEKQRTSAAYILFPKSAQQPAPPAPEAIQKFYDEAKAKAEAHAADATKPQAPAVVLSPERRTVKYVIINLPSPPEPLVSPKPEDTAALPEDQRKAKEEEYRKKVEAHEAAMKNRAEVMKQYEENRKQLLRKASDLSAALTSEDRAGKSFEELVKEAGLEPKISDPFTQAEPPADFQGEQELVRQIFDPATDPAISHTVQTSKGYALYELGAMTPPALLPFEEVKGKIGEELNAKAVEEATRTAATTARNAIQESMKSGKSFGEATAAAGVTAVEIPAYTTSKPPANVPNQAVITGAAAALNPGEVSEPQEVPEGQLLVAVLKRELPQDPQMEEDKKKMLAQRSLGGDSSFPGQHSPLLEAWFNSVRRESDLAVNPAE